MKIWVALLIALAIGAISATILFAQDKTTELKQSTAESHILPTLTDAEKVSILKLQKQQSDLNAQENSLQVQYDQIRSQAQEIEQQKTSISLKLQAAIAEAQRRIGDKYTIDADTLDVKPAPPPPAKADPSKNP